MSGINQALRDVDFYKKLGEPVIVYFNGYALKILSLYDKPVNGFRYCYIGSDVTLYRLHKCSDGIISKQSLFYKTLLEIARGDNITYYSLYNAINHLHNLSTSLQSESVCLEIGNYLSTYMSENAKLLYDIRDIIDNDNYKSYLKETALYVYEYRVNNNLMVFDKKV